MKPSLTRQCVAEFLGTFTLIFIGVGAVYNLGGLEKNAGWLGIALAHGLAITVMVSATSGISGGHLNPAVTFGLWFGGKIELPKLVAYWISQLLGATVGAMVCAALLKTTGVSGSEILVHGTPHLNEGVGTGQGIGIEAVVTFFLVFVVYGTTVDGRAPKIGGLAIGLTIVMDMLFAGPFTGGSMNPARTFGPAFVGGFWHNHSVYWIGPLLGGGLAGLIYGRFLLKEEG